MLPLKIRYFSNKQWNVPFDKNGIASVHLKIRFGKEKALTF